MLIGRAKAYGRKWGRWVDTGQYVKDPRMIAEKYREKKLLEMDIEANYAINPHLEAMARSLQLM